MTGATTQTPLRSAMKPPVHGERRTSLSNTHQPQSTKVNQPSHRQKETQ